MNGQSGSRGRNPVLGQPNVLPPEQRLEAPRELIIVHLAGLVLLKLMIEGPGQPWQNDFHQLIIHNGVPLTNGANRACFAEPVRFAYVSIPRSRPNRYPALWKPSGIFSSFSILRRRCSKGKTGKLFRRASLGETMNPKVFSVSKKLMVESGIPSQ